MEGYLLRLAAVCQIFAELNPESFDLVVESVALLPDRNSPKQVPAGHELLHLPLYTLSNQHALSANLQELSRLFLKRDNQACQETFALTVQHAVCPPLDF